MPGSTNYTFWGKYGIFRWESSHNVAQNWKYVGHKIEMGKFRNSSQQFCVTKWKFGQNEDIEPQILECTSQNKNCPMQEFLSIMLYALCGKAR